MSKAPHSTTSYSWQTASLRVRSSERLRDTPSLRYAFGQHQSGAALQANPVTRDAVQATPRLQLRGEPSRQRDNALTRTNTNTNNAAQQRDPFTTLPRDIKRNTQREQGLEID